MASGTKIHADAKAGDDVILWFVQTKSELDGNIKLKAELIHRNSLWILWPKKTSGKSTDLSQQSIREKGLAAGLVDYKICSVDSVWSGLLFTRRKIKKEISGRRS